MKLYFLRHAIAVERGTPGYEDDSARPLTAQGRIKMGQNARGMKALGLTFDLIVSSPYLRARETAEIVVDVFKLSKAAIVYTKNLTPEAPPAKIIEKINKITGATKKILLVGHEPHLGLAVQFLLCGKGEVSVVFKKGGLCELSAETPLNQGCASLEWLLSPSQLRLLSTTSGANTI